MGERKIKRLLVDDPITGEELVITELAGEASGITIRGRFEIPRYAKLSEENEHFLETFLRCRGMINSVERELGISYPTVKSRLDALLQALDLTPIKEETAKKEKSAEKKAKILEQLEKGEITAEQAKAKLKGGAK
ncbi:MAG: hypothetical protein BGO01_14090 [Armatimonadetes bacterium 55-13]|nr:DUF2089 domain-containing protein [Armatimonadota bacterium]OJU64852.1 MAG: hypothetical protein BGO01_14090 [Armatimonadetes bacterium 55-13]